jgi:putative transcriptional regulator
MPTRKIRPNGVGDARRRAGLTQDQLATLVGVSRITVARVEGGKQDPTTTVALGLARGLGHTVEDLFGGDH